MTEIPENLTIRPGAEFLSSADLLSHVLAQIRLTGERVYSCDVAEQTSLELKAGAAHVCIVTKGALRIEGEKRKQALVERWDLILLPRGAGDLRLTAVGSSTTVIVCHFWFDPESLRSMFLNLPRCIHVTRAEGAGWLEGVANFLLIEASDVQPGAALMISRLIDLVVIRALRSWVQRGHTAGWFGGLTDARIARALKAIHERPTHQWSIEKLSGIAGMSRSSFCERFTALVGCSPVRYHNEWRLTLARDLLTKPDARVGEIGLRIGYESETAFSRAYKAFFGHSPRAAKKPKRQ
jgi:AraC-like DNA-binding protein